MRRALSIVFSTAPFAIGLAWFVVNDQDMRMLFMALAAYIAGALAMALPQSRTDSRREMMAFTIFILATSTLLSALTGYAIGMGYARAVWFFAFALGICTAGGYAFYSHTKQL